jgi:elongation factor 2
MCAEPIRGVRFNLMDCKLITDHVHRGAGQLVPAARRVYFASELTAEPRLVEPIFLCEIQAQDSCISGIYATLT